MVAQFGVTQPQRQTPVVTPCRLVVEQQRQPFGVAEAGDVRVCIEVGEGMGHAGKAELVVAGAVIFPTSGV